MTTVVLVGLIAVLLVAAAYVGLLLVRRSRPAAEVSDAGPGQPRTVADLVRRRSAPPPADLSGEELFTPPVPRPAGVQGVPSGEAPAAPAGEAPGAPAAQGPVDPAAAPSPAPRHLVTPADGLEVGDAPWRRAARINGTEPGGAWETAPIPTVQEPDQVARGGAHRAPEPAPPADAPAAGTPAAETPAVGTPAADGPVADGAPMATDTPTPGGPQGSAESAADGARPVEERRPAAGLPVSAVEQGAAPTGEVVPGGGVPSDEVGTAVVAPAETAPPSPSPTIVIVSRAPSAPSPRTELTARPADESVPAQAS